MHLNLLGLGTAQPAGSIDQQGAASQAATLCCDTLHQHRVLRTIYRQTRVQRRGSVLADESDAEPANGGAAMLTGTLDFYPVRETPSDRGPAVSQRMDAYAQHALPLACTAARRALDESNSSPEEIAHLITVSCTGFSAPGLDVQLIETLGLRADTTRTMIGFMGCHGAINGLRAAQAMAQQRTSASEMQVANAKVMLCCVELCSLHFQYGWDAQQIVANALFADGAAATVGQACSERETSFGGNSQAHQAAASSTDPWQLIATGSCVLPNSREAMTWTIGDHGFEMTLSPSVPRLIETHLAPWLTQWLKPMGLTVAEVGSWAVHPGGPRVLDAVEEALRLPGEAVAESRRVLAECGNMSSPTVLFILDRLRRSGSERPCVALAFGPGLTIEAALLA